MEILLLHTHYQFNGGEDAVFKQQYFLLSKGNKIESFRLYNRYGWLGALQFLFSIWNILSTSKLKKRICSFKSDVIHIHNWQYAMGPLIVCAIRKMGISFVLALHNYRLLCPSGSLMNRSSIFVDSLT
ncbi:glycosyltransferase family protein [Spirosoma fluviale]|uniref:hypothetical protein n=1 Tax=Spirosoma fluviale TaxID=1597977 RepID=UPI000BE45BCB|nr:hypothetical protein [Spirosoma fluviale]